MKPKSILSHQNNESIFFVGGPIDSQYLQVAKNVDCYTFKSDRFKNEETGDDEPQSEKNREYVYRKKEYPWKDGRIIKVMVIDNIPDAYLQHLAKNFEDGIAEGIPLPIIFLCLPTVSQFIAAEESES